MGEVKVHNTMTVRIDEDDATTSEVSARAWARGIVSGCAVEGGCDNIDIHETEAFRDGE